MWGLDRYNLLCNAACLVELTCVRRRFARPAWTTGTTLPAAFVSRHASASLVIALFPDAHVRHISPQLAGIAAGVLIYWGGKQTRRTELVEDRLRTALEMEHEQKRTVDGDGASITVEEADEVLGQILRPRNPGTVDLQEQVPMPGAVSFEDHMIRRDAEKGLDPVGTFPAATSSQSVHVVEEMVVPPVEDLHLVTSS